MSTYANQKLIMNELLDPASERSLIPMLQEDYRQYFLNIPATYLAMSEEELVRAAQPSLAERRLRVAFWLEFENAATNKRKMRLSWVCDGIMTKLSLVQHVLSKPNKLAWIIQKPMNYDIAMQEALLFGVNKLREILEMPLLNNKGEYDPRRAMVLLTALGMIDQRVKGSVIQKIQSMNVNVEATGQQADKILAAQSTENIEDIDRRIAELEGRAKEVRPLIAATEVITIDPMADK